MLLRKIVPKFYYSPYIYFIQFTLFQPLRQHGYSATAWTTIAGPIEEGFNTLVAERYPELNVDNITLIDPTTGREIEASHFAVTLGSLLVYVAVIDTYLDPLTDAFAGWCCFT